MSWIGCRFLSHLSESGLSVWLLHHSLEQRFRDPGSYLMALAPSMCAVGGGGFIFIQQGVRKREGGGKILPRRWLWARPRSRAHSLGCIPLVNNAGMATSNLKESWEMLMKQWAQEVGRAPFSHFSVSPPSCNMPTFSLSYMFCLC